MGTRLDANVVAVTNLQAWPSLALREIQAPKLGVTIKGVKTGNSHPDPLPSDSGKRGGVGYQDFRCCGYRVPDIHTGIPEIRAGEKYRKNDISLISY